MTLGSTRTLGQLAAKLAEKNEERGRRARELSSPPEWQDLGHYLAEVVQHSRTLVLTDRWSGRSIRLEGLWEVGQPAPTFSVELNYSRVSAVLAKDGETTDLEPIYTMFMQNRVVLSSTMDQSDHAGGGQVARHRLSIKKLCHDTPHEAVQFEPSFGDDLAPQGGRDGRLGCGVCSGFVAPLSGASGGRCRCRRPSRRTREACNHCEGRCSASIFIVFWAHFPPSPCEAREERRHRAADGGGDGDLRARRRSWLEGRRNAPRVARQPPHASRGMRCQVCLSYQGGASTPVGSFPRGAGKYSVRLAGV